MAPVLLTSAAPGNVRLNVSTRVAPSAPVSSAPSACPGPTPRPNRAAPPAPRPQHVCEADKLMLTAPVVPSTSWNNLESSAPPVHECALGTLPASAASAPAFVPSLPSLPSTISPSLATSSGPPSCISYSVQKDQNSVTIKPDTSVKDAAGAIVKVLDRLCSTIVSSLQEEPGHEALNRACKALAVCRKYLTDTHPGMELSFLPVNRSDDWGHTDSSRFAFLTFKSRLVDGVQLASSTAAAAQPAGGLQLPDLHVSSNSDTSAVAAAIIRAIKEQGQAILKAGGGTALFAAMTAVIRARATLKASHAMDLLIVPQWVTEDTRATLGRESKFLQFNLLPAGLHGVMEGLENAMRPPAVVPVTQA